MDENQKNDLGYLEKLALLSDTFLDLFPQGTSLVVFELIDEDYRKMQKHFRTIDHHHEQFTVEISGVDFHFMLRKEQAPISEDE
jgi:hypothetical protein